MFTYTNVCTPLYNFLSVCLVFEKYSNQSQTPTCPYKGQVGYLCLTPSGRKDPPCGYVFTLGVTYLPEHVVNKKIFT